jgi:hypothetical protein
MEAFRGNAVPAQSGEPTTVINASAGGGIEAPLRRSVIGDLYGANNRILGIVEETRIRAN